MKRIINFANGAAVRCPKSGDDVDVIGEAGCMPDVDSRCPHLDKIDVGEVDCKWTEPDGLGHSTGG